VLLQFGSGGLDQSTSLPGEYALRRPSADHLLIRKLRFVIPWVVGTGQRRRRPSNGRLSRPGRACWMKSKVPSNYVRSWSESSASDSCALACSCSRASKSSYRKAPGWSNVDLCALMYGSKTGEYLAQAW